VPADATVSDEASSVAVAALASDAADVDPTSPASPLYFDPSFETKPVASKTASTNARAGSSLNMRASDLHLSNEELIAVMSKVRSLIHDVTRLPS
jgi:hypothetical protein